MKQRNIFVKLFLLISILWFFIACSGNEISPLDFEQSGCIESSINPLTVRVMADPSRDQVTLKVDGAYLIINYQHARFRCSQKVTFIAKQSGNIITIYVQPVDMNPSSVTRCDCEYTIKGKVGPFNPGTNTVNVIRKWDNYAGTGSSKEVLKEKVDIGGDA